MLGGKDERNIFKHNKRRHKIRNQSTKPSMTWNHMLDK